MRFLGLSRSKQQLVRTLLLLIVSFTIALAIYSYAELGYVGVSDQELHLKERSRLHAQVPIGERVEPADQIVNDELEALSRIVQEMETSLPSLHTDIETLTVESQTEDDGKYLVVGENLQIYHGKRENLLFLKTHKCGTSSMVNIFYLWAVRRRKNFVLQPWSRQLDITKELLPPRPGQDYNVQVAHARFRPQLQHAILPKERTFYTTIVRSTLKRFVSAFIYYGKDRSIMGANEDKSLSLTLEESINLWFDKNEAEFKPNATHCSIGFVVNGLSYDLGFEEYLKREGTLQSKIDDFLTDMASEFDLVLLTDYFEESLVLLKEMMGWKTSDIMFLLRFYSTDRSRRDSELSPETEDRIRKYNLVDDQLYNLFHQLFRMKVRDFGESLLMEQTEHFRKERNEFEYQCFEKPETGNVVTFSKTWKLTEFGKKEHGCTFLHLQDIKMAYMISEIQTNSDFTDPEGDELMRQEKWGRKEYFMEEEIRQLIQGIQADYDDLIS